MTFVIVFGKTRWNPSLSIWQWIPIRNCDLVIPLCFI
jgi:hypothetical protein